MPVPQIVVDTNVLIAALRSRRGASFRLLTLIGAGRFEINVSVPLVLEYEDSAKRLIGHIPLTAGDIDDIIDYLCAVAHHHEIYYLWRPFLKDAKDDMVLELAVAANCDRIVTFNTKDFTGTEQFGIRAISPRAFLQEIGGLP
ncbi:MAG: putative toxin-antitoxin system toxin component, PIN family [Chloroflexi bacterium]|nr:putative toxin-antitoxin system toxin component, PIN family [Chloroflexota bacterium]